MNFQTDDGVFNGKINVVVKNITMLNRLIQNLKKLMVLIRSLESNFIKFVRGYYG